MEFLKSCLMAVIGILSGIYLMNIGMGVVEIIPDNIPVAGNLDETIATLLLMNALAYFGINLQTSQRAPKKLPDHPENQ